jgi:hypothetical protein
MNIEKRIHQGITVIGVCLAILMMIIGMVGLYYAAVSGELIIADVDAYRRDIVKSCVLRN